MTMHLLPGCEEREHQEIFDTINKAVVEARDEGLLPEYLIYTEELGGIEDPLSLMFVKRTLNVLVLLWKLLKLQTLLVDLPPRSCTTLAKPLEITRKRTKKAVHALKFSHDMREDAGKHHVPLMHLELSIWKFFEGFLV
jgi:hypothetical protein